MVPDKENLSDGATFPIADPDPGVKSAVALALYKEESGIVADVEEIHATHAVTCVVAAGKKVRFPHTSQSPAVKLIEVKSFCVLLEIEIAEADAITLETNSPTLPVAVLSLVVVPTIPPVVGLKVTLVAVAAPKVGVTNVGLVVPAKDPVPD